ncbi:MAG: DUF58 domain-containing protein [Phycisphaerae bacterium]|nr:DUF58 domain-containing protein [Phycisphaerae bacterium]NIX29459.1 DUF58 domain-containing protein [Phycisphaerae bacterium]
MIFAFILYFLANQTQIGWLYIFTASLLGFLIVAFFYSQGMLKPLRVKRLLRPLETTSSNLVTRPGKLHQRGVRDDEDIEDLVVTRPTLYEDDPIEVTLQFEHLGLRPAFLISGYEACPFAPSADQDQPWFIPSLFRNQRLDLSYQTVCHRRGLYVFSALRLETRGPFGLFKTHRAVTVPTEVLISPFYHPLKRLRILEKRQFFENQALRVGAGSEVIGTRDYQPGDSWRKVHWRSTARTGKLVVKEFSDDQDLALTVVMDLSTEANVGQGKFSTFETAVRIAASLGYYATHNKIPFYLLGANQKGMLPATPLSWWACLNYLAKVDNDGQKPLEQVLADLPVLSLVVVLVSNPSELIGKALLALQRRGIPVLPIFITPDGEMLPQAQAAQPANCVGPHNWAAVLEHL